MLKNQSSQICQLNDQLQALTSERAQLRSAADDYNIQIRQMNFKINQMDLKIQEYENRFKIQDTQRQEYFDRHSEISSDVHSSPSKYYYFTKSCMNANESLMYYYINYILKEILPAAEFPNYYIFPQVSIYSFIKVHSSLEQDESEYASRNYWAKSMILLSATVTKQTDNICTPLFYLWNWMVLLIFHQQNTEPKPLDASRKMTDSKIHFLVI